MNAYVDARGAIGSRDLLGITANFRSAEPILDFVNARFEGPLSAEVGQPGFTPLSPIVPEPNDRPSVVALDVADAGVKADQLRDAEADAVADLCSRLGLMHDRRLQRFSVPIFGSASPDYEAIKDWNVEELRRERVRLWYVAATRARDLLVLPRHSVSSRQDACAKMVDLDTASLPSIDVKALGDPVPLAAAAVENDQDRIAFAKEAADVMQAHRQMTWNRPSRSEEQATAPAAEVPVFTSSEAVEQRTGPPGDVIGGAVKGTLLHKLMEEVRNLETADDAAALESRASVLMEQLGVPPASDCGAGIAPKEIAATVVRTLDLPEIVALRPRLVPELPVFGCATDESGETLVSGVADAVAYDADGAVEAVVDWKSDVDADAPKLAKYRAQIESYGDVLGARKRLIVLMSHGRVVA